MAQIFTTFQIMIETQIENSFKNFHFLSEANIRLSIQFIQGVSPGTDLAFQTKEWDIKRIKHKSKQGKNKFGDRICEKRFHATKFSQFKRVYTHHAFPWIQAWLQH